MVTRGRPGNRLDDPEQLRRPVGAPELMEARCEIRDPHRNCPCRSVSSVATIAVLRRYSDWMSTMSSSTTSVKPLSSPPASSRGNSGSPSKRGKTARRSATPDRPARRCARCRSPPDRARNPSPHPSWRDVLGGRRYPFRPAAHASRRLEMMRATPAALRPAENGEAVELRHDGEDGFVGRVVADEDRAGGLRKGACSISSRTPVALVNSACLISR